MKIEFELSPRDSERVREMVKERLRAEAGVEVEGPQVAPDYLMQVTLEAYTQLLKERERERQLKQQGPRRGARVC